MLTQDPEGLGEISGLLEAQLPVDETCCDNAEIVKIYLLNFRMEAHFKKRSIELVFNS